MFNLILTFVFSFGLAFAEQAIDSEPVSNLDAVELEEQYLGIANKLAELHNQHGACGPIESYTSDIVESLTQAKRYYDLNAGFNELYEREFTPSDEVLKALSTTLVLREIMGQIDYFNIESFETALEGVVMHGPSPGAFGHTSYLEFGEKGSVVERRMNLDEGGEPFLPLWEEFEGIYQVEEQNDYGIVIVFNYEADGYEKRYVLNYSFEINQWYLLPLKTIEFFNNPFMEGYVDLPDECSA